MLRVFDDPSALHTTMYDKLRYGVGISCSLAMLGNTSTGDMVGQSKTSPMGWIFLDIYRLHGRAVGMHTLTSVKKKERQEEEEEEAL